VASEVTTKPRRVHSVRGSKPSNPLSVPSIPALPMLNFAYENKEERKPGKDALLIGHNSVIGAMMAQ
jgi:hypothetical protein